MSETQTKTATETDFDLTPPDPVPQVAPEKASGLVPVSDDVKIKLQTKVDAFVDDLVAQDANSPEFGKKVDQLTNMGRKEIAAAAGQVEPLSRSARFARWTRTKASAPISPNCAAWSKISIRASAASCRAPARSSASSPSATS